MAMLVVRDISHSFGGPPVLDGATVRLDSGDRICLFGRNGEGKSTLLSVIAGLLKPDSGAIDFSKGSSVGLLLQDIPMPDGGTVLEVVTDGLGASRDLLRAYQHALHLVSEDATEAAMAKFTAASDALEAADGWATQQRVETALSRLGLNPDDDFSTLSGGWRRRVALARALAVEPDVLLLDEPTNHLDIDSIEWLEDVLVRFKGAIIFVSHDRSFVRRVATRIVELDRGQLVEYPADFDDYLDAKDHALEVEATQDALFDKKLADEETWIRTGIKARRTRNEGRVRALKALRTERRARRNRKGAARIVVHSAERTGQTVVETEDLSFEYEPGNKLINGLTMRIRRGERVGLIGPNGVGKTTLLRLLMGDLEPTEGTVRMGTKLQVRYYDQLREQLDDNATLAKTIAPDGDRVMVNGEPRHVVSYLRDFLFDDAQAMAPVRVLSGGERNRLLLAKLFAEPANVLVLDEPTNDLDVETLQVLEDQLLAFGGAILLVSHDREFLDAVATQSLVFEGKGVITHVVGGYDEWARLRAERRAAERSNAATPVVAQVAAPAAAAPVRKLTYGEKLELEALPAQIEKAEAQKGSLQARLADPKVTTDRSALNELLAELERVDAQLAKHYARWEQLE